MVKAVQFHPRYRLKTKVVCISKHARKTDGLCHFCNTSAHSLTNRVLQNCLAVIYPKVIKIKSSFKILVAEGDLGGGGQGRNPLTFTANF